MSDDNERMDNFNQNEKFYSSPEEEIEDLMMQPSDVSTRGDAAASIEIAARLANAHDSELMEYELQTLLEHLNEVARIVGSRKNDNPLMTAAMHLAEMGEFEKAKSLLTQNKLIVEAEQRCKNFELAIRSLEDILAKPIRDTLDKARRRIRILEMDESNSARFDEIREMYSAVYEYALMSRHYEFLLEYIYFLFEQKDNEEALRVADAVTSVLEDRGNTPMSDEEGEALVLLGKLYTELNDTDKAESLLRKAYDMWRLMDDPLLYESYMAKTCSILAEVLMKSQKNPEETKKLLDRAFDYYVGCCEYGDMRDTYMDIYGEEYADVCRKMGRFYETEGRPEQANYYYEQAEENIAKNHCS